MHSAPITPVRQTLPRRAVLFMPLLYAACSEEPAPSYPPPTYDYLPRIDLKVGRIDIDDSWTPRGASRHVEFLAPYPPRLALRRMAEDRLVPAGDSGRAVFVIEDAGIIRAPQHYEATLAVRLDIADDSGARLGQASARVTLLRPVGETSERAVRDDLHAFVRELMAEMNVEFEYQLRRALKAMLHTTTPAAPAPAPVETQTLEEPATPRPNR